MNGNTSASCTNKTSSSNSASRTMSEETAATPAAVGSTTITTTTTTTTHGNNIMLVAGQAGPNNFAFSPDSTHLSFLLSPSSSSQVLLNNINNNSSANDTINKLTTETKLYAISLDPLKPNVKNSTIRNFPSSTIIQQQLPITNPAFVQQHLMFPLVELTTRTNCTSTNIEEDHPGQQQQQQQPVVLSLEEKLRRERQRIHYNDTTADSGLYTYTWSSSCCGSESSTTNMPLRILLPLRGNIYIQTVSSSSSSEQQQQQPLHLLYDKANFPYSTAYSDDTSAIDPQISPNGLFCAFVVGGEIYIQRVTTTTTNSCTSNPPQRLTFGSIHTNHKCIQNGLADFLSQEEMDRYRGFWWTPDSKGIFFAQVDESDIPIYRIIHPNNSLHKQPTTCINTNTNTHDTSSSVGVISLHSSHDFFQLHQQFYNTNTPATKNNNTSNSSSSSSSGLASSTSYEDHRYPFAGCLNPKVRLGYIPLPPCLLGRMYDEETPYNSYCSTTTTPEEGLPPPRDSLYIHFTLHCQWFEAPKEVCEYLTRLYFLPDGSAVAQWQNRQQNLMLGVRIPYNSRKSQQQQQQHILWEECTKDRPNHQWINLHNLYQPLKKVYYHNRILPSHHTTTSTTSFSFLLGSEQSGFLHLYLYTYTENEEDWLLQGNPATATAATTKNRAQLIRAITSGPWMVEEIVGVNEEENVVYVTGTYHSPLERHLYAVPLMTTTTTASSTPTCLTFDNKGMHTITMDSRCQYVVDASSDLSRPPSIKVYSLHVPSWWPGIRLCNSRHNSAVNATDMPNISSEWLSLLFVLHDALQEPTVESTLHGHPNTLAPFCSSSINHNTQQQQQQLRFTPPQLISFPSSDGSVELHAAVYLPDPSVHGPGPYPLACAVYGGPHVQRVNRSYNQCLDMRAQRLKGLGFAVMKCDNRGSARRGVAFENPISRKLGHVEVEDQVTAVQYVIQCGVADPQRIGIYGWSYGGYLAAMCLCRAPHIFRVAVAGAPVTSWDGYDTHYTERYMGLPQENREEYRSSALLDAVSQLQIHQKLMIVHGLIDENVHFRHTERLVRHLVALGKEYDLLLFPEERHSPRRLRDRVYMEQQISGYFVRHLMNTVPSTASSGTGSKEATTKAPLSPTTQIRFPTTASVIQKIKTTGSGKVDKRNTNYNAISNAIIGEHPAQSTGSAVPSGSSSDYLRPIIRGHL